MYKRSGNINNNNKKRWAFRRKKLDPSVWSFSPSMNTCDPEIPTVYIISDKSATPIPSTTCILLSINDDWSYKVITPDMDMIANLFGMPHIFHDLQYISDFIGEAVATYAFLKECKGNRGVLNLVYARHSVVSYLMGKTIPDEKTLYYDLVVRCLELFNSLKAQGWVIHCGVYVPPEQGKPPSYFLDGLVAGAFILTREWNSAKKLTNYVLNELTIGSIETLQKTIGCKIENVN